MIVPSRLAAVAKRPDWICGYRAVSGHVLRVVFAEAVGEVLAQFAGICVEKPDESRVAKRNGSEVHEVRFQQFGETAVPNLSRGIPVEVGLFVDRENEVCERALLKLVFDPLLLFYA